jgi:hypothetical protein
MCAIAIYLNYGLWAEVDVNGLLDLILTMNETWKDKETKMHVKRTLDPEKRDRRTKTL